MRLEFRLETTVVSQFFATWMIEKDHQTRFSQQEAVIISPDDSGFASLLANSSRQQIVHMGGKRQNKFRTCSKSRDNLSPTFRMSFHLRAERDMSIWELISPNLHTRQVSM